MRADGSRIMRATLAGAVVRDERVPAELLAVLDDEVEEGVDRVQAALGRDLAERLADHGGLRAGDDPRVWKSRCQTRGVQRAS